MNTILNRVASVEARIFAFYGGEVRGKYCRQIKIFQILRNQLKVLLIRWVTLETTGGLSANNSEGLPKARRAS